MADLSVPIKSLAAGITILKSAGVRNGLHGLSQLGDDTQDRTLGNLANKERRERRRH